MAVNGGCRLPTCAVAACGRLPRPPGSCLPPVFPPSSPPSCRLRHRIYWSHQRTPDLEGGGEHVAFQRMAHAAGLAFLDEDSHLCIHPRFGPWFSLRCCIIFDEIPYNQVGWVAGRVGGWVGWLVSGRVGRMGGFVNRAGMSRGSDAMSSSQLWGASPIRPRCCSAPILLRSPSLPSWPTQCPRPRGSTSGWRCTRRCTTPGALPAWLPCAGAVLCCAVLCCADCVRVIGRGGCSCSCSTCATISLPDRSRKFQLPELDVEAAEAALAEAGIDPAVAAASVGAEEEDPPAAAAAGSGDRCMPAPAGRPGSSRSALSTLGREGPSGSGGTTPAASSGRGSPQAGLETDAAGELASAVSSSLAGASTQAAAQHSAAAAGSAGPSRRSDSNSEADAKPCMRAVTSNWRCWVAVRDSPCPGGWVVTAAVAAACGHCAVVPALCHTCNSAMLCISVVPFSSLSALLGCRAPLAVQRGAAAVPLHPGPICTAHRTAAPQPCGARHPRGGPRRRCKPAGPRPAGLPPIGGAGAAAGGGAAGANHRPLKSLTGMHACMRPRRGAHSETQYPIMCGVQPG